MADILSQLSADFAIDGRHLECTIKIYVFFSRSQQVRSTRQVGDAHTTDPPAAAVDRCLHADAVRRSEVFSAGQRKLLSVARAY